MAPIVAPFLALGKGIQEMAVCPDVESSDAAEAFTRFLAVAGEKLMSESGESLTGPGFLPAPVTWTAARIAPAAAAVPPRLAWGQGEGDGPPPVPPFRHVPSGLAGEWTMGSYLELGA